MEASLYRHDFFFFFFAALGLCCCMRVFSSCSEWGLLFLMICGLLTVVASLVTEHRLYDVKASAVVVHGLSSWGSQVLETGSAVVKHRLSCSAACAIFQSQWLNLWFLDWTCVSCICRRILYHWATREALHRQSWLNHWPLMTEFNLQLLPSP